MQKNKPAQDPVFKVTPTLIKEQWGTPQEIEQVFLVTESNVRRTCASTRLSDEEKIRLGNLWLVRRDAAERLWKKRNSS